MIRVLEAYPSGVRGTAKTVGRVSARATVGGRLAPDTKGCAASEIARPMSCDCRDRDKVSEWAAGIARELRRVAV